MPAPLPDLITADTLLSALGSFWTQDFANQGQLTSLGESAALLARQQAAEVYEYRQSLSRETVPLFCKEHWVPWSVLKTDVLQHSGGSTVYGGPARLDSAYRYKQPSGNARTWSIPIPDGLANARVIVNRLLSPSIIWTAGAQFSVSDRLYMPEDPFVSGYWPVAQTAAGPAITFWFYVGDYDRDLLYRLFGYVVGVHPPSGNPQSRRLINAIWDVVTAGPNILAVYQTLAAVTGAPRTIEQTETIERVVPTADSQLVVTDKHVYTIGTTARLVAPLNSPLPAGTAICDAVQIYETTAGVIASDLTDLAIDKVFTGDCYYGALVFPNREVPLEVTAAAEHPSGRTFVKFGLGGFPQDVERFFAEIHDKGQAAADETDECDPAPIIRIPGDPCAEEPDVLRRRGTLAHLLDVRPYPDSEPTTANLPRTINPFQFLIRHVLRGHICVVRIRTAKLPPKRLGLQYLRVLHKIVPPHTALLVVVEAPPGRAVVDDATLAGRIRRFTATPGRNQPIGPAALTTRLPRPQQIRARCQ